MVGVFLHERREQNLVESGAFVVRGLHMGRYVAHVFRDHELRGQAEVWLEPDEADWTTEISVSTKKGDTGTLRLRRK